MNKNDDFLYHLASSPDYASFNGLQARLGRNITESDLERVLPKDIIEALKNQSPREPFLDSDVMGLAKKPIPRSKKVCAHTSVFFWGTRGAGKTSVIGTLLACLPQDWIVRETPTANRSERALEMREFFQPGTVVLPNDTSNGPARVQYSRVYYKEHMREYAISLIEAPLPENGEMDEDLEYLLKQDGEQIHILCFDYTQDQYTQSEDLCNLLDMLERYYGNPIKERTAGIYVLVTKTDAMYRVPMEHRADAAQTLITAGNRMLWSKIWNLCYRYGIRGTFPVSYSIGQVQLRQLANIDLSAARKLWEDILIPFSQPIPTRLETVLWTGNGWVTMLLFILSLAGMGKLLVDALHRAAPAPDDMLESYEYVDDFLKRESRELSGKPYNTAKNAYRALAKDLDTESSIMLANDTGLMAPDEVRECRRPLVNDMARIAVEDARSANKRDVWNENAIIDMRIMFRDLRKIDELDSSNRNDVNYWHQTYSTYLDSIMPFCRSVSFSSLDDVITHRGRAEGYKQRPPFNESSYVKGVLGKSVAEADENYAQDILRKAKYFQKHYDLPDNNNSYDSLDTLIAEFKSYLNVNNCDNYGYDAYSTILDAQSVVNATNCRNPKKIYYY